MGTTHVTFLPDFCAALANTLVRFSSGRFEEIGTHVLIDGKVFYCQLDHAKIFEFAQLHESRVPSPAHVTLETSCEGRTALIRLDPGDIDAILFVCDKIMAGADPVLLSGEVQVQFA